MTVQIEREIPFDLKKQARSLPEKLSASYLSSLPHDEVGTCLMFFDGSRRDSDFSFITHDVFGAMKPEDVRIKNILFSVKKASSLLETMEVVCDRKLLLDIRQGLEETKEGKLISEKDFLKKHNLK